jgi:SAM-dependent methyltransferase
MILRKAVRRYHTDGIRGLLRAAKGRLLPDAKYQVKLHSSFEDRWRLVLSGLPKGCSSLLDLGSNLGAFTARAAEEGFVAVGIEKDSALVRKAVMAHLGAAQCSFMRADLDLAICEKLPQFDVILVLSVHHHWHHVFGPPEAAKMLRCVLSKAEKAVIFEGPSRSSRYESNIPEFQDNSDDAVIAFYDDYLERTLGDLANRIERLGKANCVGEREPHRWIYAITK